MSIQFYPINGHVFVIYPNGEVYTISSILDTEWKKLPNLPCIEEPLIENKKNNIIDKLIENKKNNIIDRLINFGIKTVQIPAGSFIMGSAADDPNSWSDEKPKHLVTLKSFAMSQTLITQAQWEVVAKELPKVDLDLNPNPSKFKGQDLPVEQVSWEEAMEFCNRMTQYTKHKITLPSEAQWEYACRAGTTTTYSFGDDIDETKANYHGNNINQTTPVYTYPPNPWSLYDMHGNVYEWCLDDWHKNYEGAPTDGSAWYSDGDRKVFRGGSCYTESFGCRSAFRNYDTNSYKFSYIGFRIVINS